MLSVTTMSDRREPPVEKLVIGVTLIGMALTASYKAWVAIVEHKPIHFKFPVSPTDACVVAALSMAFGLYFVITWWRERHHK